MKILGKIILLEAKAVRDSTAEALSYGRADEPSPELLLRRGRATLFATGSEAEAALTTTIKESIKNGDQWPNKFKYKIVTVEAASKREWVGLTEKEIDQLNHTRVDGCNCSFCEIEGLEEFAQSIEARLRDKNG